MQDRDLLFKDRRLVEVSGNFNLDLDIGVHGGIFCNGAIHWYTDSGPSLCFDVDQEQIREMPMPAMPEDW
ncbi:conserved hypothetical protein [Ricinus communis]|uniref:Uncharacterized protein n=1 Tax=Ricinus communis TaxID=3988 RepID=B9R9X4_RICCO|nr:conserved hypothetical protein [Ricinus communis]